MGVKMAIGMEMGMEIERGVGMEMGIGRGVAVGIGMEGMGEKETIQGFSCLTLTIPLN